MDEHMVEANDLERLAMATATACALPAVATIDWCDRAARCVMEVIVEGEVIILAGRLSEAGRVLSVDAVGAAAQRPIVGQAVSREHELRSMARCMASVPAELASARGDEVRGGVLDGFLPGGLARADASLRTGDAPVRAMMCHSPKPMALSWSLCADRHVSMLALIAPAGPSAAAADERGLRALCQQIGRRSRMALSRGFEEQRRWISPREQEVLERIIQGRSARGIAQELGRSTHTIQDHIKSLHRKLEAGSRGELIARALGLIPVVEPQRLRADPELSPDAP